ncbi:MAG: hypothetical protein NTU83_11050 [Candidatus Hydrogenedentes bacterium]|nr:hypothetical protein [Candidatus Hydrogenedentota bacterium]
MIAPTTEPVRRLAKRIQRRLADPKRQPRLDDLLARARQLDGNFHQPLAELVVQFRPGIANAVEVGRHRRRVLARQDAAITRLYGVHLALQLVRKAAQDSKRFQNIENGRADQLGAVAEFHAFRFVRRRGLR